MSAEDAAGRGEAGRTPAAEDQLKKLVNLIQYAVRGLPYHQDPLEPILRPLLTEREELVAALREALRYVRPVHGDVVADRLGAALSKAEGGTP